jgi:predicted molibdopterin-dependent oxidoreductase YjgC
MLPDDHAGLPAVEEGDAAVAAPKAAAPKRGDGLTLVRYRSLFSGPAVERVDQLQFQRPADEIELSYEDATARGIAAGSTVTVSSNGTSRSLRARVNRRLRNGVVRIPSEHAEGLHDHVEVTAG